MKIEIEIGSLPSEAPAWAHHLQRDIHHVLMMQVETLRRLGRIEAKESTIMTSVADVKAKADALLVSVQAESSVVDAVKAVVDHSNDQIATLKQQLADAIAAGVDPAAVQALSDTIDAIQAAETSNAQKVADAVTAGTPAAE
jgi:hypothetical protein